jgi:hypothetical protein
LITNDYGVLGEKMLKKNYSKSGKICRVTFKYNNSDNFDSGALVGEFNNWSLLENPMKKLKNGSFSATLSHKYILFQRII